MDAIAVDSPVASLAGAGAAPADRTPRLRRPAALVVGGSALLVGLCAVLVCLTGITQLRWRFLVLVLALAAFHYLATAIALRAVATTKLPLLDTALVQLAAAAASRLTPAGIGGAAVNARYLTRRGHSTAAAVGAVAALSAFGAIGGLLVLVGLVVTGSSAGLIGAGNELAHIGSFATGNVGRWLWIPPLVVVVAVLLRRQAWLCYVRSRARAFLAPSWGLVRRPRDVVTVLLAAGATKLCLGMAFVATTAMVPGAAPSVGVGALLVAFMIGSAAGSSIPIPAGLGSTEAALTAVLVSVHVPAAQAVNAVLAFRVLTFWLPAAIGVLASRFLRRRGDL